MRPHAVFALPDGSEHSLGPGDLIGRLWSCALCLDDGRVSEAHALVSGRGDELRLLALRGRFAVDGAPVVDATLHAGQVITLAAGLDLRVRHVYLPDAVLGVEGPGVPRQAIVGVTSVKRAFDGLRLVPGHVTDADAHVWSTGEAWHAALAGGAPAAVDAGDVLKIGEHNLRFVDIPLGHAAAADTRVDRLSARPMRVVARFQDVRIFREGEPVAVLDGIAARIVSELVAVGGPVSWLIVAREVWREEDSEARLRHRWDVALVRLRARLQEARIPRDFVRCDRSGFVSLSTTDGDELVDET
jgi:hypothetical protein